jgi:hypothetical protein
MSASKKSKTPAKSRAAKKLAAKPAQRKQTARAASRNDGKRARTPSATRDAAKSPRKPSAEASRQTTRLTAAALGQEERKPAKKAEARPNRPPAVLPIPQSTFFF